MFSYLQDAVGSAVSAVGTAANELVAAASAKVHDEETEAARAK